MLSRTGATVGPHVRLPRGVLRLPPGEVVVEGVHGGGGPVVRHYHAPRAPGERGVVDNSEPSCEYLPEYGGPVCWFSILSFVTASEIKFCLFLI